MEKGVVSIHPSTHPPSLFHDMLKSGGSGGGSLLGL
jgi:hypothetical protein